MAGLRTDQVALYKADMYKTEQDTKKELKPKYPEVYKVEKATSGAGNKETQLLGAGRLERKTEENAEINFKSPVQGWTTYCSYDTYSAGLALSKEAVEDTKKGPQLLKKLAAGWTRYGTIAKETLASKAFDYGGDLSGNDECFDGSWLDETDPSGDLLYDGKPLFNLTGNARTTKGGGTYYNSIASLTMNPDDFETLYNLMTATNNRDEEDEIVGNPVDTILCKPGSDKFKAERIVNTSKGLPSSQNNDKNPYYGIIDKIIAWDYLDARGTENAFFVGKRQHEAFTFQERQEQETDFFRDKTNRGYKASVDMRFGLWFKVGAWRAWGRGGGTSA